MLLGNKMDIAEKKKKKRMIMTEEGEKICSDKGIYWGGECSAKTFDENKFKEIFSKLVKQIYLKLKEEDNDDGKEVQKKAKIKLSVHKKKIINAA